jgi:hypothetical protein
LLVVLPRHAHGDEGAHVRRTEDRLRRDGTCSFLAHLFRWRSSPPEPGFARAETIRPVPAQPLQACWTVRRTATSSTCAGEYNGAIRIDRRLY